MACLFVGRKQSLTIRKKSPNAAQADHLKTDRDQRRRDERSIWREGNQSPSESSDPDGLACLGAVPDTSIIPGARQPSDMVRPIRWAQAISLPFLTPSGENPPSHKFVKCKSPVNIRRPADLATTFSILRPEAQATTTSCASFRGRTCITIPNTPSNAQTLQLGKLNWSTIFAGSIILRSYSHV